MDKVTYLAGGCFWGTEKFFSLVKGVMSTEVGYSNGFTKKPSYRDVCQNNSGHAETVKIVYDDSVITLNKILSLFYEVINPTAINRQGGDVGSQYRTGVYYTDENDSDIIKNSIAILQNKFVNPIAIEVLPLYNYYKAEEYHQKYLDKNPDGYCHIGKEKFAIAGYGTDE